MLNTSTTDGYSCVLPKRVVCDSAVRPDPCDVPCRQLLVAVCTVRTSNVSGILSVASPLALVGAACSARVVHAPALDAVFDSGRFSAGA